MAGKFNYGKIVLVIILTVLIWVWADLAVDETHTFTDSTIRITKTTDPDIWASFNEKPSIDLEQLTLVGPASRISELRRQVNEGTLELTFFLNPSQEGMTDPGQYNLDVLNFLRQSEEIEQVGLSVKSCEPARVQAEVVAMEEKPLQVRCFDDNGNLLEPETLEPARVTAHVPQDWSGQMLVARVTLSPREIEQARLAAVRKKPQFDLAPGWTKTLDTEVEITLPARQENLSDFTVTSVPGFVFSANLAGKYSVDLLNQDTVLSPIAIRATPAARRAYENQRYQVLLEIDDSDVTAPDAEPIRRELIYNFPEEYLQSGQIELRQQPVIARFRLIPVQ